MFDRVAVLGLGLIGGSFAAAVKRAGLAGTVAGYAPAPDGERAGELGLVDLVCGDVPSAVAGAALVVLAAPVTQFHALFQAMAGALADDVVITDCASTKRSVNLAAQQQLGRLAGRFVAGHPIAGSEHRGPDAARADLFDSCQVMLCPATTTDADAVSQVSRLWRALNANVVITNADNHDRLYGELSHWPHVVAFALSAAVGSGAHAQDALRFAGGGLRDTTRIGASSPALWADILLDNRDAVLASAAAFEGELTAMRNAIAGGRRDVLIECLSRGSNWRRKLV